VVARRQRIIFRGEVQTNAFVIRTRAEHQLLNLEINVETDMTSLSQADRKRQCAGWRASTSKASMEDG